MSRGPSFGYPCKLVDHLTPVPVSNPLHQRTHTTQSKCLSKVVKHFQLQFKPLWHLVSLFLAHLKPDTTHSDVFSVFQFTYTTLFGWFAAFLFVKTSECVGLLRIRFINSLRSVQIPSFHPLHLTSSAILWDCRIPYQPSHRIQDRDLVSGRGLLE